MYKFYSFIGLFRKGDKHGDEVSGLCLLNENYLWDGEWELQKYLTCWMVVFLNHIQYIFLTT